MVKRLILTLIGVLFVCIQVSANNYRAKLTAKVTPSGLGTVYIKNKENSETSDEGETAELTIGIGQNQGAEATFTVHAIPAQKDGSTISFIGWSVDEFGAISDTDNPLSYTVKTSEDNNVAKEYTLFAHFKEITNHTLTMKPVDGGTISMTAGTHKVTNSGSFTTDQDVTFTATAAAGKKFAGWYQTDAQGNKTYFSTQPTVTRYIGKDATIGALFVDEKSPVFLNKTTNTPYTDLTQAVQSANGNGTIILLSDGILTGKHTIPAGVTLLIPFNADNTCYKEEVEAIFFSKYKTPYVYRTLTMAEGSSITLQGGELSVSAQMSAINGGSNLVGGGIYGPYGRIHMEKGSSITLNGSSSLYAWGYIDGEGEVKANDSSRLYEGFQITDFRGGTATSDISQGENSELRIFPLNQYYVQNIEVPVTYTSGATELVASSIYASQNRDPKDAEVFKVSPFVYIGKSGLFSLSSQSTLTKRYDATRDRQVYVINGDAQLGGITVEYKGASANSDFYVLPLTNNLSITVESGTLTYANIYGIALLPGAELTILPSATLQMGDGDIIVYDSDDWGAYSCYDAFKPLPYTSTPSYTRTQLYDATLDVQGTISANGKGNIYTTSHKANICCSENSGTISFTKDAVTTKDTYQAIQYRKDPTDPEDRGTRTSIATIPLTLAHLYNELDGTYTSAAPSTTYHYVHGKWQTTPLPPNQTFGDINNDGKIDRRDAEVLSAYLTGLTIQPFYKGPADVNNNGHITLLDLVKLISLISK